MSSSSDENELLTPEFIKQEASLVVDNLLPAKSRYKYIKAYDNFMKWRTSKQVKSFSESVLLVYFQELSQSLQASTLWSIYSMLKATMNNKHNIQINTYTKLTTYLKRFSEGHQSKKAKVLTAQNIETFLNEAPDQCYLLMKVALIFGLNGACRGNELLTLTTDNVQRHSDKLLLVILPDTKTKRERSFLIPEDHKEIVERYQALRPTGMDTNRFFVQYRNGKCLKQVVGKNKISTIPREIASFLNLPNPELYTGHCFRRTSATLLADSGADLTSIKRHGGWRSSTVAEGYIENSLENKTKINSKIVSNINLKSKPGPSTIKEEKPSTSKENLVLRDPPLFLDKKTKINSKIEITQNSDSPLPAGPSTSKKQKSSMCEEIPILLQNDALNHNDIFDSEGNNLPVSPSNTTKNNQNMQQSQQFSATNTHVQNTTISVPNKTIHLTIQNCSNITLNF